MWFAAAVTLIGGAVVAIFIAWKHAMGRNREERCTAVVPQTRRESPPSSTRHELVRTAHWIRHGERLDHVNGNWLTSALAAKGFHRCDPPLSPLGCLQALETGLWIRAARLKQSHAASYMIRSSPALRCVQTSMIIAVVGFDGFDGAAIEIDERLTDYLSSKLYKSAPDWCCKQHSLKGDDGDTVGSARMVAHPAVEQCVRDALHALRRHSSLCKRFRVKDKQLERWERAASAVGSLRIATIGRDASPQFPETEARLRLRCAAAFEASCEVPAPAATTSAARHDAMLVCVTHADVIRGMLETSFPRVRHTFEGFSVPYCSRTTCARSCGGSDHPHTRGPFCIEAIGDTAHLAHSDVRLAF